VARCCAAVRSSGFEWPAVTRGRVVRRVKDRRRRAETRGDVDAVGSTITVRRPRSLSHIDVASGDRDCISGGSHASTSAVSPRIRPLPLKHKTDSNDSRRFKTDTKALAMVNCRLEIVVIQIMGSLVPSLSLSRLRTAFGASWHWSSRPAGEAGEEG
jgi:hypothetical protein